MRWSLAAVISFMLFLGWETFRPFFPFFEGSPGRRGKHIACNIGIALLNVAMVGLCFQPLWSRAAAAEFGLLHRFTLSIWLHALLAILLLDCWTYWWHRANHEIQFLWRFHRMHHSDPWMDVSTARRFHPGEILFSSLLRLPLIFLLDIHLWELLLYGTLMGVIVDFHHSNIALSKRIDRWLCLLIPTPAMHKVHHSIIQRETNSNYTSLLSVWDRLFGSFRLRSNISKIKFGLDDWSDPEYLTLKGMIKTPFFRDPERNERTTSRLTESDWSEEHEKMD